MVKNIKFKAIVTSIKNYFLHQLMVDFINKLQLSNQKYQTNGNVRVEYYNGKFVFPMKDFFSLVTYTHSIYFMSTSLLKDSIHGVCVPQFQLA